jgi:hypothetical protein
MTLSQNKQRLHLFFIPYHLICMSVSKRKIFKIVLTSAV